MEHCVRVKAVMSLLCVCLLTLSCGLEQIGEAERSNSSGVWEGPSFGKGYSETLHAVALEYPQGYDWHSDPEKGNVKCSLVLFAGSTPVLRIPVSDKDSVSSDIGRHRLVSGHLYTDFTDGVSTVIKKDGKTLYTVHEPESIVGLVEKNGFLHVLSQPSDGQGFRYRVDGELVLERTAGTCFSYFDVSDEGICFFFSQQMTTTDGTEQRYYKALDGKVSKLEIAEGIEKVRDIRLYKGDVCMLSELKDISGINLQIGDDNRRISGLLAESLLYCGFEESDELCVRLSFLNRSGDLTSQVLHIKDDQIASCRTKYNISAVYADDMGCVVATNPSGDESGQLICPAEHHILPSEYAVYTKSCLCRKDSVLCAGLSSVGDRYPIVWKEYGVDTLKINGFISSLQ